MKVPRKEISHIEPLNLWLWVVGRVTTCAPRCVGEGERDPNPTSVTPSSRHAFPFVPLSSPVRSSRLSIHSRPFACFAGNFLALPLRLCLLLNPPQIRAHQTDWTARAV